MYGVSMKHEINELTMMYEPGHGMMCDACMNFRHDVKILHGCSSPGSLVMRTSRLQLYRRPTRSAGSSLHSHHPTWSSPPPMSKAGPAYEICEKMNEYTLSINVLTDVSVWYSWPSFFWPVDAPELPGVTIILTRLGDCPEKVHIHCWRLGETNECPEPISSMYKYVGVQAVSTTVKFCPGGRAPHPSLAYSN